MLLSQGYLVLEVQPGQQSFNFLLKPVHRQEQVLSHAQASGPRAFPEHFSCKLDRTLSFIFLTDDDRPPEERFELISQLGEVSYACVVESKQCRT